MVVGDAGRLRQVLVDLLSNAVKFTLRGEVVVSLGVEEFAAPPEVAQTPQSALDLPASSEGKIKLHFEVRDTGIGIPESRMDRLFQSFSQVDASTTRHSGGTGLGLAISRRLCEIMGGEVWVESVEGAGSTFHFTILGEPLRGSAVIDWRGSQPPRLAGRRLLIVDDNATNRQILSLQARSWGMIPRASGSPVEALEWVTRGDPFDLAILDMQMPEMDGMALAEKMRKLRSAEQLPLVMLTSLGWRESAGGDFAAFLTKPIKPSHLFDVLIGIFHKVSANEAAQKGASTSQLPAAGRILLAEDNAINQKVAVQLLARLGYRADVAANGLEVLKALELRPYSIVLMDVQMPEMDGLEAARRICRQWPRERRPRMIAMTANAMQGDREACLAAGMDDYIAKPVRLSDLEAALRSNSAAGKTRSEEARMSPAIDWDVVTSLRELQSGSSDLGLELI